MKAHEVAWLNLEALASLVAVKLTDDARWGADSFGVRQRFDDHVDDALARIITSRRKVTA